MIDCRTLAFRLVAVASLGALASCVQSPSAFQIAANQSRTPSCDGGTAPVVGRISGTVYSMPGQRPVSYVGCFNDMPSCEAWRRSIVGTVNGRIIYNECTPA